jgi:hypothetical protein
MQIGFARLWGRADCVQEPIQWPVIGRGINAGIHLSCTKCARPWPFAYNFRQSLRIHVCVCGVCRQCAATVHERARTHARTHNVVCRAILARARARADSSVTQATQAAHAQNTLPRLMNYLHKHTYSPRRHREIA